MTTQQKYNYTPALPQIRSLVPPPDKSKAVCHVESIPHRVFFIEGERNYPHLVEDAKAFCNRCPEREICLEFALSNRISDGIWGARTSEERRRMLRHANRIREVQERWKHELFTLDWNKIAAECGLPKDWRRQAYDPPEYMIDSDSVYLREKGLALGCRKRGRASRCGLRFSSLEECFRHAHTAHKEK